MAENVSVVSDDNSNPSGSSANITPTSKYVYTGTDLFKDVIEAYVGEEIGRDYANKIADGDDVDTSIVRKEILDALTQTYVYHGQPSYDRKGNKKVSPLYKIPDTIPDTVIEHMASTCGKFAMILTSDGKAMLAVHFTTGKFSGLWRQVTDVQAKNTSPTTEFMEVQRWFQRWNKKIKGDALINAINNLMPLLPVRTITMDDKYRCFENGLWEFTSDKDGFVTPWEDINPELTFSHKIPFNINTSPVLTEPEIVEPDGKTIWKFTEWLHTIFNTDDECNAFMELMAAVISPQTNWKSLFLFLDGTGAATGNNSKSTLLDLLVRALGGIQGGQVTSLPVSQFGEKYAFENALNSALIVSHENDETGKISGEALAKLKAIATDNEIEVTRKFKTAITTKIHALVVQSFNRLPSFGRTAENFERRLKCFVFKNCFTGREKTYIADDYLKRKEIMEYILWYCIHEVGNIKELTKYDFFTENLSFFKTNTDSVTRFITEVLNNDSYIKNDYISRKTIYEYYKSWYQVEYGTNLTCMSRPTFWDSWEVSVKFLKGWEYTETSIRIPKEYKVQFEPFLYDYKCVGGMDDDTKREYHIYNERDFDVLPTAAQKNNLCTPSLSETIRGGIRRKKADAA